VTKALGDESALLTELRDLSERGRHRDVADRVSRLAPADVAERAPLALLAAEAHGRAGGPRDRRSVGRRGPRRGPARGTGTPSCAP
jgi:hypothetical protein